jgi:hypothetical protein
MRVRLIRLLAHRLDGIDVSSHHVGDVVDLPQHDAEILVAEGWASATNLECHDARDRQRAHASDWSRRRAPKRRR